MSSEIISTAHTAELGTLARKQAALRIAFGVTCCFVLSEALDWDATFLAPMLAAQLLIKLPRPPALMQGLGIVVVIAATMAGVLFLSAYLVSNPITLILCLGLLHYLTFYAHLRGAPEFPTLMLQTAGVAVPVFVVVSPSTASQFVTTLISAGIVAIGTVWAAHAVFPAPPEERDTPVIPPELDPPHVATALALEKTIILMPILAWFILDASKIAVVVLIMIITLLRLLDPRLGGRTAIAIIFANLLGGATATVAYNLVKAGGSITALAAVILCLSLVFAGRIVTSRDYAPIYAVAFATFILLLGSGLSPLPGGSEEAAVTRILNVVMATVYAASALSLFQAMRSQRL
jgi:DUF2955 family protein